MNKLLNNPLYSHREDFLEMGKNIDDSLDRVGTLLRGHCTWSGHSEEGQLLIELTRAMRRYANKPGHDPPIVGARWAIGVYIGCWRCCKYRCWESQQILYGIPNYSTSVQNQSTILYFHLESHYSWCTFPSRLAINAVYPTNHTLF